MISNEDKPDEPLLSSSALPGLVGMLRTELELSEVLNRDYKEVHRNVNELEGIGVVELEENGRAKKPVFGYDEIEIQISL
jgi:predicted transcriptional regulator